MRYLTCLLLPLLLVAMPVTSAVAADPPAADRAAASGDDGADAAIARLTAVRPELPVQRVAPAPLPGFYVVELSGGGVLYVTADGRHVFAGDLFEVGDDDLINLAEQRRAAQRAELIAAVPAADTVAFPPDGEVRAVINVFTDIDCGYCRQLHRDVERLNALGIEVRYLGYPRAGVGSLSHDKLVTAWCADDQQDAMTRLKAGEELPHQTCDNPVADHYALGGRVGVAGTPSIVLTDGRMIPGYVQPEEMAARIGLAP